jgi:hypothetical protein
MMIGRNDVVARVNPGEATKRNISEEEMVSRVLRRGYRNVVVTTDCAGFGVQTKMSVLAAAVFIGDIIQAVDSI